MNALTLLCGCTYNPALLSIVQQAYAEGARAMRDAMEEIRQIASGERQVASDDTEGMAIIAKKAEVALRALPVEAAPATTRPCVNCNGKKTAALGKPCSHCKGIGREPLPRSGGPGAPSESGDK